MKNRPILFFDSGIGGIPYCRFFIERNPGKNIEYLADRRHYPYGPRKEKELVEIISALMARLVEVVDPQIVVIACNTATLTAIRTLRERFPALSFVGTEPAIKPAALASKPGKIGVLGTELTIKQPSIRDLAARHGKDEIVGIAAPELVEFIESRFITASDTEKRTIVQGYLNRFRAAGADTLVLGCTHFLFLREFFQQESVPDITVFDSLLGVTQYTESLLEDEPGQSGNSSRLHSRLLLTGPQAPQPMWQEWASYLNFTISLLGEP